MKYLRRACKYFVQMSLLVTVIIVILMLAGILSRDINVVFEHGWNSVALIAVVFAAFSAVYPLLGYTSRRVEALGDPAAYRGALDEAFRRRGYVFASAGEDGVLRYRLSSPVNRMARLWEDVITVTPQLDGFRFEGLSKDLPRVVSSFEHLISQQSS